MPSLTAPEIQLNQTLIISSQINYSTAVQLYRYCTTYIEYRPIGS